MILSTGGAKAICLTVTIVLTIGVKIKKYLSIKPPYILANHAIHPHSCKVNFEFTIYLPSIFLLLQSTFRYDSSHWTSTSTYNDYSYGRDGGLDNRQFKGSTYWKTSFKEICVGMKYNSNLRAFSFSYPALSLYDLIADGKYRQTKLGRNKWKSLISGSSLQRNCNREGFNVYFSTDKRVRLGIFSNQENDCNSPDSFIGLGTYRWGNRKNCAGNFATFSPDNGDKNLKVMGYILVR